MSRNRPASDSSTRVGLSWRASARTSASSSAEKSAVRAADQSSDESSDQSSDESCCASRKSRAPASGVLAPWPVSFPAPLDICSCFTRSRSVVVDDDDDDSVGGGFDTASNSHTRTRARRRRLVDQWQRAALVADGARIRIGARARPVDGYTCTIWHPDSSSTCARTVPWGDSRTGRVRRRHGAAVMRVYGVVDRLRAGRDAVCGEVCVPDRRVTRPETGARGGCGWWAGCGRRRCARPSCRW